MPKYRFEQFVAIRQYRGGAAYSPDGTVIAHVTNTTGQFNLWTVPSGGGAARQLTGFTDNTVRGFQWSPDGTQLVIQADQNGDEQHQLYLLDANGGWPEAITNNLQAQHNLGDWSRDGRWLAYAANDRSPGDMDVVIRDMESGDIQRITDGGLFFPVKWSPDGRYLTLVRVYSNTNQDICLYDRESGELRNLTAHEGEIIYSPASWKYDGSGFYMVSNNGREFNNAGFYDLAADSWDWDITPDYDVENGTYSIESARFVWSVNEGGASKLHGRDEKTANTINMPDLPPGVIDSMHLSPDGKRLALVFARAVEAHNLYEINLETGEINALGQSMLGGIDVNELVEPEIVRFPTFDGREIPAWLYKPDVIDGMTYPVVLSIHGGPEAQERPQYNYTGLYQYLLERGFGVLAPNIRGSTGYGISYQKLIHRDWGGAELKDIEHAAKYLQSLDWVDSNRLAVFGGSFGGFATLSAVTRLPEYWAVGVDIVGPSNLISFTQSVPEFWKPIMKSWVGDPEEDKDMLIERSPITYVDNIRAPLLVIQGANDPRVVQAESDQMVERIQANGGDVTYYVDKEEGHGATRRANQIKWNSMIAGYLVDRLLDEPSPV